VVVAVEIDEQEALGTLRGVQGLAFARPTHWLGQRSNVNVRSVARNGLAVAAARTSVYDETANSGCVVP